MKFLDIITERKILWELRGLLPKLKKFLKNVDDDGNLITDEVESSPTNDTSESNNTEDTEEPTNNEEDNNEEDNNEEDNNEE